jgi:hypothetical protein
MLVDQTVTHLEMISPDQLNLGRVPPAEIVLDSVHATALPLIRSTHDRIGAPHHTHPGPEVEISTFGLVPEFVGRGVRWPFPHPGRPARLECRRDRPGVAAHIVPRPPPCARQLPQARIPSVSR